MDEAALVVSKILDRLAAQSLPGTNLLELEEMANRLIESYAVKSANKGYQPKWAKSPFPAILCLSVNDTMSHGIPFNYVLIEGDILTIDVGIKTEKGFCGDAALTIPIGKVSNKDERLLRYAREALYVGIAQIAPGVDVSAVGRAIQLFAYRNGYKPIRTLDGHFIGKEMHLEPGIPNFDVNLDNTETKFKIGDVVCIEPHLTYEDQFGYKGLDGWTIKSRDGKKSAMFEHMVEVIEGGSRILTTQLA